MSKELNNLINNLAEHSFKELVKEYNKEKYKTTHVRIIDGPYDGGNDLEIFVGEKEIKKNIQSGQEIQTRDIVDFGISVVFAAITISNPIGIIGLGIYGLLDAYGAFDGIKSTYLNQTIIPASPTPIKP